MDRTNSVPEEYGRLGVLKYRWISNPAKLDKSLYAGFIYTKGIGKSATETKSH